MVCHFSNGTLSINFLGREYEISSCGVNPMDGKPVDVNNRNVLAYYTLSKGVGEPAFSFVPISYLAGTGIILSTDIKWMTDPLGKTFSGNYVTFNETMCRFSTSPTAVLRQLDQKSIYPHYDFKHLTEKYFEIGMKLNDFSIQLVKY